MSFVSPSSMSASKTKPGKRGSISSVSMPDISKQSSTVSSPLRSKTVNFPKIKSKDSSNSNSTAMVTSVSRILSTITQILQEDGNVGNNDSPFAEPMKTTNMQNSKPESNMKNCVGGSNPAISAVTEANNLPPLSSQDSMKDLDELQQAMTGVTISSDTKRKLMRHCLEIKRLMDKEGPVLLAESSIQKSLFSKNSPNISSLLKCIQAVPEVDLCLTVTNLLVRVSTTTEMNSSNLAYMAKKNLTLILLKNLQFHYHDYLTQISQSSSLPMNSLARLEDILSNTYTMIIKLSKHDPKLPIIARLHKSVESTIDLMSVWFERKEYLLMLSACSALRAFASRNDNNILTVQKSNVLCIIQSLLKNPPSLVQASKLDTTIELLAIIARSKTTCLEILKDFGMKFFLTLAVSSADTLQKSCLKLIRVLIEHNDGKTAFQAADGPKILTEALHNALHAPEMNNLSWSLSNSVPSLLVSVLRAAVAQSDLPFLYNFTDRVFPLPPLSTTENDKSQNLGQTEDYEEYENALDEYVSGREDILLSGLGARVHSPNIESESEKGLGEILAHRLRRLCPEWDVSDENGALTLPVEAPAGNIRVRHVQPMAPGKHFVCKNISALEIESQLRKSANAFRKCIYEQTARMFQQSTKGTLIYDVMDERVAKNIGSQDGTLLFDSRFESGNLQMAIRVSEFEYDLIIQSDINSTRGRHNQWFYFSVQRMVPNAAYKFNILNMSKPTSQFNNGMQPVMYSTTEPGWRRVGDSVFYIKNHYRKSNETSSNGSLIDDINSATFSTLTFTVVFKHAQDTCFIAYHYPYTYSELQRALYQLHNNQRYQTNCRRSTLCQTLGGNECVMLTITDFSRESQQVTPMPDRKYVLLSGRVHPGESNSSHIMNGIIQFLLSDTDEATQLRQRCIFKIVPMLNPDGVVNGSHRCSLAGLDLNRQWKRPVRILTPTIFWTKMLWKFFFKMKQKVLLACDLHGHSRRKNIFAFGCENGPGDKEGLEKIFPSILANLSSTFDMNSCKFSVERSKEATARVVLWRECNLINSFTLESSYCGSDFGEKRGLQFTIPDLEKAGADFCAAILQLSMTNEFSTPQNPSLQAGSIQSAGSESQNQGSGSGSAGTARSSVKSNQSLTKVSTNRVRKAKSSSAPSKKSSASIKARTKKAVMEKRESQTSLEYGDADNFDPAQDDHGSSSSDDDDG